MVLCISFYLHKFAFKYTGINPKKVRRESVWKDWGKIGHVMLHSSWSEAAWSFRDYSWQLAIDLLFESYILSGTELIIVQVSES